jgi:hypothetical protein
MNEILTSIGVAGHMASPPETSNQPPAETIPSGTTGQPPSLPHNTAKFIKKQVVKAKREFRRQTVELIKTEGRGFYLRVSITLAFLWLKIGAKDAYVDEVLTALQEEYQGAWVPSRSTLQHYEGPMLRWLVELARRKNPDDPNLREKFTPAFLGEHPQYIANVGKAQVEELCRECQTLVRLDQQYANGCVKPAGPKAELRVTPVESAAKTEPVITTEPPHKSNPTDAKSKREDRSQSQAQPRQPATAADTESEPPSNDDLLMKIHVVQQTLSAMKEAGIPINRDAENAILRCCLTVKDINRSFNPQPFPLTVKVRGIASAAESPARTPSPAQSPALPISPDSAGSCPLVDSGADVPKPEPAAKPAGKRLRAAKSSVGMPPKPRAPLPGPDRDQPLLFPLPNHQTKPFPEKGS